MVFKFVDDFTEDDDNVYYDVGVDSWLHDDITEDMESYIRWPPENIDAGKLVRKQQKASEEWDWKKICIKKFYGKLNNLKGTFFIVL